MKYLAVALLFLTSCATTIEKPRYVSHETFEKTVAPMVINIGTIYQMAEENRKMVLEMHDKIHRDHEKKKSRGYELNTGFFF